MARMSGARITGVSNNGTTLEHARGKIEAAGLGDRVTLERVADEEYLRFRYPDGHFDVVTF
jgi:cyclopropane fatty-acyl-phospholipid synthase-like methyltransferase